MVDDETMYFSSQRRPKSLEYLLDLKQDADENIYVSQKQSDGYWSPAAPLDDLNTAYKEGSPCVSEDGRTLVFTRCHTPDGFGNCDLYTSTRQEDPNGNLYWSPPENMGAAINSYAWDSHPNLVYLQDTLYLYFASDRREGFGGTDIYFSLQNANGQWQKVKKCRTLYQHPI